MLTLLPEKVERYLEKSVQPWEGAIQEIEREGAKGRWPIVGPQVGNFLEILARSVRAKQVLELGTAIGYSSSWLARAVGPDGKVTTIEIDPKTAETARRNHRRVGVEKTVEIVVGGGLEKVRAIKGSFDFAFMDHAKTEYPECLEHLVRLVRPGGIIAADNVLWSGSVADPKVKDADTEALREYVRRARAHPKLRTSIVPLRDGVAVSLRLD
jgi:predicted O-methyltransferase YrrM